MLKEPERIDPVKQVLVFGFLSSLCMEYGGANVEASISKHFSDLSKMFS
jgi:hypothetical protein